MFQLTVFHSSGKKKKTGVKLLFVFISLEYQVQNNEANFNFKLSLCVCVLVMRELKDTGELKPCCEEDKMSPCEIKLAAVRFDKKQE